MDPGQKQPLTNFVRHAAAPVLAGLAYLFVAIISIDLTSTYGGVAPIWPANAVILAVILLRPVQQAPAIIAVGLIANILSVFASGGSLETAILYAVANLV